MRLDLKERIAKVFNQIFIGGVGDAARWSQHSKFIEDMSGVLDVFARTVFVISQSHSVEVRVEPAVCNVQTVKLDQDCQIYFLPRGQI